MRDMAGIWVITRRSLTDQWAKLLAGWRQDDRGVYHLPLFLCDGLWHRGLNQIGSLFTAYRPAKQGKHHYWDTTQDVNFMQLFINS